MEMLDVTLSNFTMIMIHNKNSLFDKAWFPYDGKDRQRRKDRTILWPAILAIIAAALKRMQGSAIFTLQRSALQTMWRHNVS